MNELSPGDGAPRQDRRVWSEYGAALLFLCVLAAVYYWRQLLLDEHLYWGDVGLYFAPMEGFFRDNILAGRFPLWNPMIYCGTPYIGNPQVWPLYPSSLLLAFFKPGLYNSMVIAGHTVFAGFGTYVFVRRTLATGKLPALLAAIAFAFGGQFVSKEQFPNMLQAAAWMPWVLLLTHRAILRQRWLDGVWVGAAIGLQLLAAHAQMSMLTLYLATMYGVVVYFFSGARSRVAALNCLGLALLALLVAFCLSAGQLLPVIDLVRNSEREHLSFGQVDRFHLGLDEAGNFLIPNLFGHPYTGNFHGKGNYWETCCYVGVIPCLLGALGLLFAAGKGDYMGRERRSLRFWGVMFFTGTVMAFGGPGLLYYIAYAALPGFKVFHDPARCLLWAAFALSILAAAGAQSVIVHIRKPGVANAILALACFITFSSLAIFGQTVYPLTDHESPPVEMPVVHTVLADPLMKTHQARYIAPDGDHIWHRFTNYHAYRQDEPHYDLAWGDSMTPNLMMSHDLFGATGYEPALLKYTENVIMTGYMASRQHGVMSAPSYPAAWLGFLSVRYLVATRVIPPHTVLPGFQPMGWDPTIPTIDPAEPEVRTYLAYDRLWLPRARLITDFREAGTQDESWALMQLSCDDNSVLNLERTTVVAGTVGFPTVASEPRPAVLSETGPDEVVVHTDTARPSVLIVADSIAPGWTATLDGAPARILPANACLRAVPIPIPARHTVVFTYRPTTFLIGLYLTLTTVGLLFGFITMSVAARTTRTSPGARRDRTDARPADYAGLPNGGLPGG